MKLNEITNPHAEIEALLDRYKIENYTIRPDGTVDVNGSVTFNNCTFTNLPIKFGKVTGNFGCYSLPNLKSLINSPTEVRGDFTCTYCTMLDSFVGAPLKVGTSFIIRTCNLISSLKGLENTIIDDDFVISSTALTSLEGSLPKIGGFCGFSASRIVSGGIGLILTGSTGVYESIGPFRIIENYFGRPDDIFECQAELIEAGFAKHALM